MKRIGFLVGIALVSVLSSGNAASLNVYVQNVSDVSYVTRRPYMTFPASMISDSSAANSTWIPSDQFIQIRTDQKYQQGNWAVQVYTDNVDPALSYPSQNACPASGITSFNLPDFTTEATPSASPVTARYKGSQFFGQGDGTRFPKSGLVSVDGETRLPIVWRVMDGIPSNHQSPQPVWNTNSNLQCDFTDCAWFFMKDKREERLSGGAKACDFPLPGQPEFDYTVPLNQAGGQYAVGSRWQPSLVNGNISQYIFLATNFHNATVQAYETTVFVELLSL